MVVLDELLPTMVAQGGLFLRRADDVREEDGREHAVEVGR
jgi:hypothetical protein